VPLWTSGQLLRIAAARVNHHMGEILSAWRDLNRAGIVHFLEDGYRIRDIRAGPILMETQVKVLINRGIGIGAGELPVRVARIGRASPWIPAAAKHAPVNEPVHQVRHASAITRFNRQPLRN
jgi:hypothetical protein